MMDFSDNTTLYSDPQDYFTDAINYVFSYKEINVCNKSALPASLKDVPLPALIHDKFLVYGRNPILEFIEERFPSNPCMPLDPKKRAVNRMIIDRILTRWYPHPELAVSLLNEAVDALGRSRFFLSKTVGLIDCMIYPILKEVADYPQLHHRYEYYNKDLYNELILFPSIDTSTVHTDNS